MFNECRGANSIACETGSIRWVLPTGRELYWIISGYNYSCYTILISRIDIFVTCSETRGAFHSSKNSENFEMGTSGTKICQKIPENPEIAECPRSGSFDRKFEWKFPKISVYLGSFRKFGKMLFHSSLGTFWKFKTGIFHQMKSTDPELW